MRKTVFVFHFSREDTDACWVFSTKSKAEEFSHSFIKKLLKKKKTDTLNYRRCEILEYPLDPVLEDKKKLI